MIPASASCRARAALIRVAFFIEGIALVASAHAGANGIDRIARGDPSFPDQYLIAVNSGTPTISFTETGINPLNTFDGIRDISLDINGGTGATSSKLNKDPFLSLDNDANTSAILTLDYGAQGNLNRNFLFGGKFNAIGINVATVYAGPDALSTGSGTFSLTLRSGSTIGTSVATIDFNSSGSYFFSYEDPGFAGINFSHIDEVILTLITTTPGSDFQIDSIYRCATIPEPGTYTLLLLGAAGLGLSMSRRFVALV